LRAPPMPPGLVTAGMATAIPTTATPATLTRPATTSISRTPSIPTTSGATGTLAGGTTAITTDLRYRGFPAHLGNPGFPHGRGWPLLAGACKRSALLANVLGLLGLLGLLGGPIGRRRRQRVEAPPYWQHHARQEARDHEQRNHAVHHAHQRRNESGAAPAQRPQPHRIAKRRQRDTRTEGDDAPQHALLQQQRA